MAILAVHRKQPNWPADPNRPIFKKGAFWVETDGDEPTMQEVTTHLAPRPQQSRSEKLDRLLIAYGLTKQDLIDELNTTPAAGSGASK